MERIKIPIYKRNDINPYASGIYVIRCKITMSLYVGQSKRIINRWLEHNGRLLKGIHTNKHLQNAFNKYGINEFEFAIIEYTEADKKVLDARERYWIKYYRRIFGYHNVYNYNDGGGGADVTPEWREHLSNIEKKVWEDEVLRAEQSTRTKEQWQDTKIRERREEGLRRYYRSEKGKESNSRKTKKTWKDPEIRERRKEGLRRYFSTEESRNKCSRASKRIYEQPGVREKVGEASRRHWANDDGLHRRAAAEGIRKMHADPVRHAKYVWKQKSRVAHIKAFFDSTLQYYYIVHPPKGYQTYKIKLELFYKILRIMQENPNTDILHNM